MKGGASQLKMDTFAPDWSCAPVEVDREGSGGCCDEASPTASSSSSSSSSSTTTDSFGGGGGGGGAATPPDTIDHPDQDDDDGDPGGGIEMMRDPLTGVLRIRDSTSPPGTTTTAVTTDILVVGEGAVGADGRAVVEEHEREDDDDDDPDGQCRHWSELAGEGEEDDDDGGGGTDNARPPPPTTKTSATYGRPRHSLACSGVIPPPSPPCEISSIPESTPYWICSGRTNYCRSCGTNHVSWDISAVGGGRRWRRR